jgi:predicted amidohydrolase
MRAHLLQTDIFWHDRRANFDRVRALLAPVNVAAGDLILLPEVFDNGFSMDTRTTADSDGATLAFLIGLATQSKAYVLGPRVVRAGPSAKASNTISIISPEGTLIDEYQKIHPFTAGHEHEAFEGGSRVVTFNTADPALTICPVICYDLRFPELFRIGLSRGAQVFTVHANWLSTRHAHWRILALARAIENQAYVLAINRVGSDPNATYLGGTIAIDPRGDVIGELGDQEGVLSVEIDPEEVRRWREKFPAVRDRRLALG